MLNDYLTRVRWSFYGVVHSKIRFRGKTINKKLSWEILKRFLDDKTQMRVSSIWSYFEIEYSEDGKKYIYHICRGSGNIEKVIVDGRQINFPECYASRSLIGYITFFTKVNPKKKKRQDIDALNEMLFNHSQGKK